jgi:hypothetical protein
MVSALNALHFAFFHAQSCVYSFPSLSSPMLADETFFSAIEALPAVFVVVFVTFFVFWSVFGLAVYHCGLVTSATTTYESMRSNAHLRNPFSKGGSWANFTCTWCSSISQVI